jgi:hypothetical protein
MMTEALKKSEAFDLFTLSVGNTHTRMSAGTPTAPWRVAWSGAQKNPSQMISLQ